MEKLIRLGFSKNVALILPHLPNIEPVEFKLDGNHGMAVLKLREEVGVLFWTDPNINLERRSGQIIFLDNSGKPEIRFSTVGHMHGRSDPSYEKDAEFQRETAMYDKHCPFYRNAIMPAAVRSEERRARVIREHNLPVATAIVDACRRLGVTVLIKHGGDMCERLVEISGLTILDDYNYTKARPYMVERNGYHFVVPAVDGVG